jgi:anhydro-N-acetylmuramic acid kinase
MSFEHFIGLMSGTSLDGVDGVLAAFDDEGTLSVRAHAYRPFPADLRSHLLALNTSGVDELHRTGLAANALARLYHAVVSELLVSAEVPASAVRAIGSHGQTVRHRPGLEDGLGYTWQIDNPALLAELSGIDVIADFRRRDIAAGGQGAPLVPAFHHALFARADQTGAVLNLGGISNLTVLRANQPTRGFDCGPANVLMDHWHQRHRGAAYDAGGAWAASGQIDAPLLALLLDEPFFTQPPPKSTGRDLFNPAWLDDHLKRFARPLPPQDVQATLSELTARSCADQVLAHAADAKELLVCGGGAFNAHLMARLAQLLPGMRVATTDTRGLPAQHVEAAAFAWLAHRHVHRLPGNLPTVTGAAGPRVLGALYPA